MTIHRQFVIGEEPEPEIPESPEFVRAEEIDFDESSDLEMKRVLMVASVCSLDMHGGSLGIPKLMRGYKSNGQHQDVVQIRPDDPSQALFESMTLNLLAMIAATLGPPNVGGICFSAE